MWWSTLAVRHTAGILGIGHLISVDPESIQVDRMLRQLIVIRLAVFGFIRTHQELARRHIHLQHAVLG